MDSILDLLYDPSQKRRKRRVMVYGPDGVGKSTWAAQSPRPLFLQTEDGLSGIKGVKALPRCLTVKAFGDQVNGLLALDPFPFGTIVIDSLTGLEPIAQERALQLYNEEHKPVDAYEAIPYGKGPQFAVKAWKRILDLFERFNIEKDVTVILIGHAQVVRFADPTGDAFDRYAPKLEKDVSAAVREWCDEYFFASHKVYTTTEGAGFRERKKATGGSDRVLKTFGAGAFLAKRRIAMPDEIEMTWQAYQQCVDANIEERGIAALDEEIV